MIHAKIRCRRCKEFFNLECKRLGGRKVICPHCGCRRRLKTATELFEKVDPAVFHWRMNLKTRKFEPVLH